ncbi:MAG TPA: rod shape-determining protein MreC [Streptosporangiaceae bacterium]
MLRRDTILFAACLALSVSALLVPASMTGTLATSIRDTALLPLIWLQQRAEEGRTSRARFRAALAERDSAAMQAQELPVLRAENERLRAMLGIREQFGHQYLAAEVLRQTVPTDGRTLLLSVGARNGARPYQPVIAVEGLLGMVSRVGATSAVATTWAHPEFRVSAVTEDGSVLGIVAPSTSGEPSLTVLEFRGVAYRDTVPDGTRVMTAGLGGVFPRGLPIGTVRGVRREQLGWERIYLLIPHANPGLASHVLLLTSASDTVAVPPADSLP